MRRQSCGPYRTTAAGPNILSQAQKTSPVNWSWDHNSLMVGRLRLVSRSWLCSCTTMGAEGCPRTRLRRDQRAGAVEFERVVPPSGNLQVCGKQFWLGPDRSGLTVTFWADTD